MQKLFLFNSRFTDVYYLPIPENRWITP